MSDNQNNLVSVEKSNYGDNFSEHLFEQYKLFVETAEKVSERRINNNSYYLTLNSFLIGIIGFIISNRSNFLLNSFIFILFLFSGGLICLYWLILIDNFKKLNSGKFKVIHEIEKLLPLKLFYYEWDILGRGQDKKLYSEHSRAEKSIPVIFLLLYLIFIIVILYEGVSIKI